jgi:hypothetical protein
LLSFKAVFFVRYDLNLYILNQKGDRGEWCGRLGAAEARGSKLGTKRNILSKILIFTAVGFKVTELNTRK